MTQPANKPSRWTLQRVVILTAGILIGLVVIGFLLAIGLALWDAERWSPVIRLLRDFFIMTLALQGILVVMSLAILILQIARFVHLLRSRVQPILDDAKATVTTSKETVVFVGETVTEPIIQTTTFVTGLGVFIREIIRIRRLLETDQNKTEPDELPTPHTEETEIIS